jgi:hypothetical protein
VFSISILLGVLIGFIMTIFKNFESISNKIKAFTSVT